jgi:hypothetical protein
MTFTRAAAVVIFAAAACESRAPDPTDAAPESVVVAP